MAGLLVPVFSHNKDEHASLSILRHERTAFSSFIKARERPEEWGGRTNEKKRTRVEERTKKKTRKTEKTNRDSETKTKTERKTRGRRRKTQRTNKKQRAEEKGRRGETERELKEVRPEEKHTKHRSTGKKVALASHYTFAIVFSPKHQVSYVRFPSPYILITL
ncbi:hypothetical protein NC651_040468 [Populus alba x Populus x berolinensis]|nr:hypothetical protein NC651_040468 [Populus alba x Populus x berolinensis]